MNATEFGKHPSREAAMQRVETTIGVLGTRAAAA
jgi:hypothetical protein